MHSFSALGPLARDICRAGNLSNYYHGTPFHRLWVHDAVNIFLGIEVWRAIQAIHYVETVFGAPYLYSKILDMRAVVDGVASPRLATAACRYYDTQFSYDIRRYEERLFQGGKVREVQVGDGLVSAVWMNDLVEIGLECLENDIFFFLDRTPLFQYGAYPFDGPLRQSENDEDSSRRLDRCLRRIGFAAPELHPFVRDVLGELAEDAREPVVGFLGAKDWAFFVEIESIFARLCKKYSGNPEGPCTTLAREAARILMSGARDSVGAGTTADARLAAALLDDSSGQIYAFALLYFYVPFSPVRTVHAEIAPPHAWSGCLAQRFGGANVKVISPSADVLSHAGRLLDRANGKRVVDLVRAELDGRFPIEDESVDSLVVSQDATASFTSRTALLGEVRRTLTSGGAALIALTIDQQPGDAPRFHGWRDRFESEVDSAGLFFERHAVISSPPAKGVVVLRKFDFDPEDVF